MSQRRVQPPFPFQYHIDTRKFPTHQCALWKTIHRKASHILFLFPFSLQVLPTVPVQASGRVPQKLQPKPPDRSPYTHEPQFASPVRCDCSLQSGKSASIPESVLHKPYRFSPGKSQPALGIPLPKRGIHLRSHESFLLQRQFFPCLYATA